MSENKAATKKEPGMVTLVLVLAVISVVMALLLGLVNYITAPAIEANTQKTIIELQQKVLPADSYEALEYTGSDPWVKSITQAGDAGYVVRVGPTSGFSGEIDMMVGITTDGVVTGIAVIAHAETSGLGSKATDPAWQAQFVDSTEEVKVQKDGGAIVSITGSTITSRAVCDGVNAARAALENVG